MARHPNRLAELVHQRRTELGNLKQDQYAARIGYTGPASRRDYIGKIERANIKREPHEDFLDKLAADFANSASSDLNRLSADDLRDAWRQASQSRADQNSDTLTRAGTDRKEIRVGFGHTVWAAPLALAIKRGWLADPNRFPVPIRGTSFFKRPDANGESAREPEFSSTFAQWLYQPSPEEDSGIYAASASDVVAWLQNQLIDIACLPRNMIESRRQFLPVGNVVDSASGCILVCNRNGGLYPLLSTRVSGTVSKVAGKTSKTSTRRVSPRPQQHATADETMCISTRTLGHGIKELLGTQTSGVCIGAETGTMAVSYLDHALRIAGVGEQQAFEWLRQEVSSATLSDPENSTLKDLLCDKLNAVIVWEPIATHLTRRYPGLVRVPLYFSFEPLQGQQHLSFVVCIRRRDSEDRLLGRTLPLMMRAIWEAAEEIGQVQRREPTETTKWLNSYYGFEPDAKKVVDTVSQALNTVRFSVYMDMENSHEFKHDH